MTSYKRFPSSYVQLFKKKKQAFQKKRERLFREKDGSSFLLPWDEARN